MKKIKIVKTTKIKRGEKRHEARSRLSKLMMVTIKQTFESYGILSSQYLYNKNKNKIRLICEVEGDFNMKCINRNKIQDYSLAE